MITFFPLFKLPHFTFKNIPIQLHVISLSHPLTLKKEIKNNKRQTYVHTQQIQKMNKKEREEEKQGRENEQDKKYWQLEASLTSQRTRFPYYVIPYSNVAPLHVISTPPIPVAWTFAL